jgi:hypothetical protein
MSDRPEQDPTDGQQNLVKQADQVKVWWDEFHRLHVSLDGEDYEGVRAMRTFPLSEKADYVSFLDEKDHEVVLLAHPRELDKESRRALQKALDRMYYVAKILRVDDIKEIMGVAHWKVETDRGYAAFEVVGHEHIRRLPGGRLIIVDVDGNRFEVEKVSRLDDRSQVLIHSET